MSRLHLVPFVASLMMDKPWSLVLALGSAAIAVSAIVYAVFRARP